VDIPFSKIVKEEIDKYYPDSQKELYIYGICEECKKSG
jgi:hypothetical protein